MIRLYLYSAALAIYALAYTVGLNYLDVGEKLLSLWTLAFLAVCGDITYQLRKSKFLFFPLVFGFTVLYQYLDLPYTKYVYSLQYLAYIPLGILLLISSQKQKKQGRTASSLLLWVGILSLIFSLRFLMIFPYFSFLDYFYQLRLESYALVILLARALLLGDYKFRLTSERYAFVFLLFINIELVISQLIQNVRGFK